ncbi:MAG: class I SAM-dependent methyltransferase, partial [Ignavibacteria bacterium]|nr:class I SAM-dependent methyltransferase [Ignavibacteria bacterium]
AFDPSSEMIKTAKENAGREGFNIDFYNYSIGSIPDEFKNKFDIAISLGNTFANIPKKKFNISVKKCFNILKKGGILLIHILNYEKVIAEKQRIVNLTEGGSNYFIRFYDFINSEIVFNILSFKKQNPSEHKLISTKLFPYNQSDFRKELKSSGFSAIEFFSDFNLSTFNKEQSKDLILKAVKS